MRVCIVRSGVSAADRGRASRRTMSSFFMGAEFNPDAWRICEATLFMKLPVARCQLPERACGNRQLATGNWQLNIQLVPVDARRHVRFSEDGVQHLFRRVDAHVAKLRGAARL